MPITITMRIAPALFVGILASANCFSPKITEGVSCGEAESCPAGMQCDPVDQRCRSELLPQGDALQLFPDDVDFGTVLQGSSSFTTTFTVVNNGLTASKALQVRLQDSVHFRITSDECQGQLLPRGGSCSISGVFEPAGPGAQDDTLIVTDTFNTVASQVSGTGLEPGDLQVLPAMHDFGTHTVGSPSASQVFTITNTGTLATGNISITAANHPSFVLEDESCKNAVLQPLETCTIRATFSPNSAGKPVSSIALGAMPGGGVSSPITGTGQATISITNAASAGGNMGSVALSPGNLVCASANCQETFEVFFVSLTPVGGNGVTFAGWNNAGPECQGLGGCSLDMDQAIKMVTAQWRNCISEAFLRCDDENLVTCGTLDGDEDTEDCEFACSEDAESCTACVPGTKVCSDVNERGFMTCDSDGFYGPEENCPAGSTCGDEGCTTTGIPQPSL